MSELNFKMVEVNSTLGDKTAVQKLIEIKNNHQYTLDDLRKNIINDAVEELLREHVLDKDIYEIFDKLSKAANVGTDTIHYTFDIKRTDALKNILNKFNKFEYIGGCKAVYLEDVISELFKEKFNLLAYSYSKEYVSTLDFSSNLIRTTIHFPADDNLEKEEN